MNQPIVQDVARARREQRARIAPSIAGSAIALPPNRYTQRELAAAARATLPEGMLRDGALERFFDRVGVTERHLALRAEEYAALHGLGERNDAWIAAALDLGERAIRAALAEAGLDASEISQVTTTTVTGLAVPSIEARLMNRLPFPRTLVRTPLFGLGCLGGAAGLARVADYLRAYPTEAAILLSVEICSLTFQPGDASVANLVSTGLFGDGAAAVVMVGADHHLAHGARPHVIASRAAFFPETERVMGWDVVDSGFKVVLSADVPGVVRANVPREVDAFLAAHALARPDVSRWVMHPGGPKVIDALEESLDLAPGALDATRQSLASVGNLSSASVLFLLDEHRRARAPEPGGYGVLMAMGPAFCAEMVLLRW